jgi:hypothetical protein
VQHASLTAEQHTRLEASRARRAANPGEAGPTEFTVRSARYAVLDGMQISADEARAHRELAA